MRISVSFFFFLVVMIGCKNQVESEIASWKSSRVTESEFKTQYVRYASSAPVNDSFESRRDYARILLERKIIADYALTFSYDTISAIQSAITRTQELSAVKQYLRNQVEPNIGEVTENDLRQAFRITHSSVKLQQIYAPTETEIDQYYQTLIGDTSNFSSLASQSMQDAGAPPESYVMGWVNWNDMDLKPEEKAFSLEIGEISAPVQSLSGWHIFRLVDKEETFFADQSTYQNSKEALETQLIRRKFEEENIRYINSVLNETPIEFYPPSIQEFWTFLEPRIPKNRDEILRLLNDDLEINQELSPVTPLVLARLNGEEITSSHFIQRLPSIPYWQLNPNLRPAIETIAKDMLFATRAEESGFFEDPEVLKDVEIERVRQLYNFMTANVSDTLNVENYMLEWFERNVRNYWKDLGITFRKYAFETESEARYLMAQYRSLNDWNEALASTESSVQSSVQEVNFSSFPGHPVFTINYVPTDGDSTMLWGPFETEGEWFFIEILERNPVLPNLSEIEEQVLADMEANLASLTHFILLKKIGYSPEDISINKELLDTVLPYYFD